MSQSANADDSLLLGTAARRQELYPDSGNYDASGNATVLDYAPPPPTTPPSFVQAGVDHWATTNTGVRNINGSQPSDMGFGILNEQYTGNAPPTPTSAMNGQRSATSMEWEHVQAEPVFPPNVGERPRPSVSPGLSNGSGMQHQQQVNFFDVYGRTPPSSWSHTQEAVPSAEPVWSQPILTTQPL